jgi:hypothetical protein
MAVISSDFLAASSSQYKPTYPDQWNSQHFIFKCPSPSEDAQNVTAVMAALNLDCNRIYWVLKKEKNSLVEVCTMPGIGECQLSATGKDLETLAGKIDNLVGKKCVCIVEPIYGGRATTYVTFDTIILKFWQYNIECPPTQEHYVFVAEIIDSLPKLNFLDSKTQLIGECNLHIVKV